MKVVSFRIIDCFDTIKYCALIITSRAKILLCCFADHEESLIVSLNRAVLLTAPIRLEIYNYICTDIYLTITNAQGIPRKKERVINLSFVISVYSIMCSSIILLKHTLSNESALIRINQVHPFISGYSVSYSERGMGFNFSLSNC